MMRKEVLKIGLGLGVCAVCVVMAVWLRAMWVDVPEVPKGKIIRAVLVVNPAAFVREDVGGTVVDERLYDGDIEVELDGLAGEDISKMWDSAFSGKDYAIIRYKYARVWAETDQELVLLRISPKALYSCLDKNPIGQFYFERGPGWGETRLWSRKLADVIVASVAKNPRMEEQIAVIRKVRERAASRPTEVDGAR